MLSNEPVYLASFEVELLVYHCYMVLPGETFIKVKSELFNRLCLGYYCLVDVHWGAGFSPESERYVRGLSLVYLQSPLLSPIFNSAQVILKIGKSLGLVCLDWV
jgi:hypothetical protein